jgi:hypothetical protein
VARRPTEKDLLGWLSANHLAERERWADLEIIVGRRELALMVSSAVAKEVGFCDTRARRRC